MEEINIRVNKLETTFNRLAGGAVVAAVLLLAYFGIISGYQIPTKVNDVVAAEISKRIPAAFATNLHEFESKAKTAAAKAQEHNIKAQEVNGELQALLTKARSQSAQLRIESGIIDLPSKLRDSGPYGKPIEVREKRKVVSTYRLKRYGAINRRVSFQKPFEEAPKVAVALIHIDSNSKRPLRISTFVQRIDKQGFNYDLFTWHDTNVHHARVSWIAYGY